MAIPLKTLMDRNDNVYEMTCVAIKRAAFITKYGDKEMEQHEQKIVSTSLSQVLENRVEYYFEKPD